MAKRSKKVQYVGIDVSAKTLQVAMDGSDGVRDLEFSNDADGHKKLCKVLTKKGLSVRVCLEATGNYSLDAAIALSAAEGVEVMIVNPKSARHFAEAQLRRAKTGRVDARALLDYAQRMPFVVWARPSQERLHLRQIARRIAALIEDTTAEKNRLAASKATGETPKLVLCDIEEGIAQLERRVAKLEAAALELIAGAPDLTRLLRITTSIKGIAERSAIRLLGELLMLPTDMSPREVVAHAGLDPRPRQSGTRDAKRQISRVGNARLRAALFLPAMVAARFEPAVRAVYERLVERNKQKLVANVAIMRRLLVALWVMILREEPFAPEKFGPKVVSTEEVNAEA
jgi:transposase